MNAPEQKPLDLYSAALRAIEQHHQDALTILTDAIADITRFEALCQRLRAIHLQFEPEVCTGFGRATYWLWMNENQAAESAGEMMLALAGLGYEEKASNPSADAYSTTERITITGENAPEFNLIIRRRKEAV